jgi:2Fe-2S ferredoxin
MPKVTFLNDEQKTVSVPAGTSILDAARERGARVGSACGGVCACSTCHVWVKKGVDSLSEMEDREQDILDKAFDVRQESRLGCQAQLGDEDVEVVITEESWDTFHAEHPDVEQLKYPGPDPTPPTRR